MEMVSSGIIALLLIGLKNQLNKDMLRLNIGLAFAMNLETVFGKAAVKL
jgi:hypothetical protein